MALEGGCEGGRRVSENATLEFNGASLASEERLQIQVRREASVGDRAPGIQHWAVDRGPVSP